MVSMDILPSRKADLDFLEIQEKGTQQWLQATAAERLQGVAHELLTRSGRPEVGILHAAEECDLIVMATLSHTIVPHGFCGSIAEKVLCQSKRPVLMVPARFGGKADLVAAWMMRNPRTVGSPADLAEVHKGGFHCMR